MHLKQVREKQLQFILQGILYSHFHAYKEVRRGDGIIDFFIIGPESKIIVIETKMSDDDDYLDGIKNQLPEYLERVKSKHGFFVVFYIDGTEKDIDIIKSEITLARFDLYKQYNINAFIIDLRERVSPSKIVSYQEIRIIKGIGQKKAEILGKAGFNSIDSILNNSTEEILSKTSLSKTVIETIKRNCKDVKNNS